MSSVQTHPWGHAAKSGSPDTEIPQSLAPKHTVGHKNDFGVLDDAVSMKELLCYSAQTSKQERKEPFVQIGG